MKESFDIPAKRRVRKAYREFLRQNTDFQSPRILCLSGYEALEIIDVYDKLGYDRSKITSCELDDESFGLLSARELGIEIYHGNVLDYLTETDDQFDIINLDFCGTFSPELMECLTLVFYNRLLKSGGILACTFMARREHEAAKDCLKTPFISAEFGQAFRAYVNDENFSDYNKHVNEATRLMDDKELILRDGIDRHILVVSGCGAKKVYKSTREAMKDSRSSRYKLASEEEPVTMDWLRELRAKRQEEYKRPIKETLVKFAKAVPEHIEEAVSRNTFFPEEIERYSYHSDKGTPMRTSIYKFVNARNFAAKRGALNNRAIDRKLSELKAIPQEVLENLSEGLKKECATDREGAISGLAEHFFPELSKYEDDAWDILIGKILPEIVEVATPKEAEQDDEECEEIPKKTPQMIDEETKQKILTALRANVSKDKIAKTFGVTKMQVSALASWITMGKYKVET